MPCRAPNVPRVRPPPQIQIMHHAHAHALFPRRLGASSGYFFLIYILIFYACLLYAPLHLSLEPRAFRHGVTMLEARLERVMHDA